MGAHLKKTVINSLVLRSKGPTGKFQLASAILRFSTPFLEFYSAGQDAFLLTGSDLKVDGFLGMEGLFCFSAEYSFLP